LSRRRPSLARTLSLSLTPACTRSPSPRLRAHAHAYAYAYAYAKQADASALRDLRRACVQKPQGTVAGVLQQARAALPETLTLPLPLPLTLTLTRRATRCPRP